MVGITALRAGSKAKMSRGGITQKKACLAGTASKAEGESLGGERRKGGNGAQS